MSAPKILAQSVPPFLSLGGTWLRPVLCRLRGTCGSSDGFSVDAANTSPGLNCTESAGTFSLTFPSCKKAAFAYGNCAVATPGTQTNHAQISANLPDAAAGTMTFYTLALDDSAILALGDNSVVEVFLWLDLG